VKWKGHGNISGSFYAHIKRGAEHRDILFDITIEAMDELYVAQNGKCALTGLALQIGSSCRRRVPTTASLDRKDSSLPYTVDNVQWVHKDINGMKMAYSQQHFIDMCRLVTEKAQCQTQ
jgi:hypothetical protein